LLALGSKADAQSAAESGRALDRNLQRNVYRDTADRSGGRGLERDLRVGGTGNYRDNSFARELEYRNAIVTGNVGGGKSFRGDAGYTAADDFRSTLASDDTFEFRRDSVSSGMFGRGLRGTESVQFQYSYTTGNNRIMRRTDGSLSTDAATGTDLRESAIGNASVNMGTIRSTSAYTSARGLTPQIVNMRRTPIGTEQTAGSNLIGLRTYMLPQEASLPKVSNPLSPSAAAGSPPSVATERIDNSFKTSYSQLVDRLNARPLSARVPPPAPATTDPTGANPANPNPTDIDPATARPARTTPGNPAPNSTTPGTIAPNGGPTTPTPNATPNSTPDAPRDPAPVPEWRRRLSEVRDGWQANRRQPPNSRRGASGQAPRTGDTGVEAVKPAQIDPEVAELIRNAGGVVSAYAIGTSGTGEAFASHLAAGQDLLAREQYFDAEERFARALSYRPGETSAQAGRAHAQLGAGLLLSAAINLHTMLLENPELIAVRYTGGTLPPKERLDAMVSTLRTDIAQMKRLSRNAPQDAAFLLAYVGFQTQDRPMISEGLSELTAPENQADADLAAFLEQVWLSDAPSTPVTPPANPPIDAVPTPVDPGK